MPSNQPEGMSLSQGTVYLLARRLKFEILNTLETTYLYSK